MKSLCLLGLLVSCHGSLLIRDPTDPCTAYGNGTTFNISSLGRMTTEECYSSEVKDASHPAVCQLDTASRGMLNYNAGDVEAAMWQAPFNFYGSKNFTVTGGDGIRLSIVTFIVDNTLAAPTFTFTGEEPYTQYNFEVRGGSFVNRD
eukprot:gene19084-33695_t